MKTTSKTFLFLLILMTSIFFLWGCTSNQKPILTTQDLKNIADIVKDYKEATKNEKEKTTEKTTPTAESTVNGGSDAPVEFDANIVNLQNLDVSDFHCNEMFPTYEQLTSCKTEFKISVSGASLGWDTTGIDRSHNTNNEEVKVIDYFFKDGRAICWKDWGLDNPPGLDDRWYNTEDLRNDGKKVNGLKTPGAQFITCVVATLQPAGIAKVSRVIARSKIFDLN